MRTSRVLTWSLLAADVVAIVASVRLARHVRDLQQQAWFWTPSWLEGEAQAQADLAAGRFERFDDADHFLKSLGSTTHPGTERLRA